MAGKWYEDKSGAWIGCEWNGNCEYWDYEKEKCTAPICLLTETVKIIEDSEKKQK